MRIEQTLNKNHLLSFAALPTGDDGHLNRLPRRERNDQRFAFHAGVTAAGNDGDGACPFIALERQFAGDVASCGCSLGFRRLTLYVRLRVGTLCTTHACTHTRIHH
jgi:hypothetical protein